MRPGPFETRYLNFERAVETLGFSGMINVAATFEGQWDDLLLATGSTDQSGTYVFEVEPQGVGRSMSKEAHYWKAADGFDTMITLWNPTDEAQDYLVTFFYGQEEGQYKLPVRLEAKGSRTIDVGAVIAAQQPDEDGNIIPLGTPEGSAALSSAAGMTEWMSLVASVGILNVQAATCGNGCVSCCGYTVFHVLPNPLYLAVGGSMQMKAKAKYCTGVWHDYTSQSTWNSVDPPIASVSAGGLATGQSPGSTWIRAKFPLLEQRGTFCEVSFCPRTNPEPVSPTTVYNFTVNISPSTIRPKDTGGTTTTTVTVQTTYPYQYQPVTLQDVRIVGSGGHPTNHPTTLPATIGSPPVSTGGTFSLGSGSTSSSDGKFTSTYTARWFGGEHQIKAKMGGVTKAGPITLRARVEGLQQLIAEATFYNSNSNDGKIAHPDNWWGTATTLNGLVVTAETCAGNNNCKGSKLPYNDISLLWGGKFDGNLHNWTDPGHSEHHLGTNCDVNVCDWSQNRKDSLETLFYLNGAQNPLLNECPDPTLHTWHVRW